MFKIKLTDDRTMVLILMKNVKNTVDIRSRIINGTLQCCIIKPSLIIDPFQVVVAANKAVLSQLQEKMTTRTLYTEILFNLSISKNITQSLTKFGIDDSERNMLVCVIDNDEDQTVDKVLSYIQGEKCPMECLSDYTDLDLVKKTYNIKEPEIAVSSILNSAVSRISTKDII